MTAPYLAPFSTDLGRPWWMLAAAALALAVIAMVGCGGLPATTDPVGAVVVFAAFEGPEADAPTIRAKAVVIVGGVRGEFDGLAGKELILRNIPFGDLDPPQQPLTVTARGYRTVSQQVTLKKNMATFVEVNMERVDLNKTGTVEGQVRSTTGAPIGNALVTFTAERDGETVVVEGFTDNQGRFIIGGIPAGAVQAEAAASGYMAERKEATVTPDAVGKSPDLTFYLLSGDSTVTVRGMVVDLRTEAPLAGAEVRVDQMTPVFSGADGNFSIPEVRVGSRTLVVELSGYERYTTTLTVRPGMGPVLVRLARIATVPPGLPYTVAGTVTLLGADSNAGAEVIAYDLDRLTEAGRATTDASGRYALFLPPGRYEIEVRFAGRAVQTTIEYKGGGRVMDGVDFTLFVGPI